MTIINGNAGNDILNGTLADDVISGGAGNDWLYGNEGNDTLNGGSGADNLFGGIGNDTMDGGSGSDTLYGGDGNDVMQGGSDSSADTLYGEAGNDTMDGGSGNDFLYGGLGNDTIIGGSGDDVMTGDDGSIVLSGPNLVVNGSFEDPIAPGGSYVISNSITGWTSNIGGGIEVENNAVMPASDGNQLVELDSTSNSNMFQDVATGGTGQFQLSFDYSPRPGVSAASNPIEVYWNGVLLDTLTGDTSGFTHHTYLVNGAGATTQLEFRAVGDSDSFGGFLDNVSVQGVEGSNDVLDGGSGNDTMSGGYGDDTLLGGSGDDVMNGGDGNDSLDGGSGTDTMNGGSGNDTLTAGSGNDKLNGDDGNDTLQGNSGNDTINGGIGDDIINGGQDADNLTGGDGADVFVYTSLLESTAAKRDLITDFQEGGTDHVSLVGLGFTGIAAGAASGSTLGYSFDGTNTIITAAGSDFSIAMTGNHTLTNSDFFFA